MTAEPNHSDLPVIEPFDDRAVRRAVLRGLLRSGLVATAWLATLLLLTCLASAAISAQRGPGFHLVAFNGLRMAHPEYEISQEGNCCATGPLYGLTNLGLASSMELRLRPVGALNYPGTATVTVRQGVTGGLDAGFDDSLAETPLRDGLSRGRPDPDGTATLLARLPEPTVVSALIELDQPMDEATFNGFFDAALPATEVPYRSVPIFLVDPYASRAEAPIGWPNLDLGELRDWADRLDASDDRRLGQLGLPAASEIKRVAAEGHVHAFVATGLPLSLARTLAAEPTVRGVNVLDVAFDTAAEPPG